MLCRWNLFSAPKFIPVNASDWGVEEVIYLFPLPGSCNDSKAIDVKRSVVAGILFPSAAISASRGQLQYFIYPFILFQFIYSFSSSLSVLSFPVYLFFLFQFICLFFSSLFIHSFPVYLFYLFQFICSFFSSLSVHSFPVYLFILFQFICSFFSSFSNCE